MKATEQAKHTPGHKVNDCPHPQDPFSSVWQRGYRAGVADNADLLAAARLALQYLSMPEAQKVLAMREPIEKLQAATAASEKVSQ